MSLLHPTISENWYNALRRGRFGRVFPPPVPPNCCYLCECKEETLFDSVKLYIIYDREENGLRYVCNQHYDKFGSRIHDCIRDEEIILKPTKFVKIKNISIHFLIEAIIALRTIYFFILYVVCSNKIVLSLRSWWTNL